MDLTNRKLTLKQYRALLSLRQDELAEKIGVSAYTLSNWETGKFKPSLENVIKIEEVLGVSIKDIEF